MEPLIDTRQVAELIGCTADSLDIARAKGSGYGHDIPYLRIGRTIRYRPEAVRAWIASKEVKV